MNFVDKWTDLLDQLTDANRHSKIVGGSLCCPPLWVPKQ